MIIEPQSTPAISISSFSSEPQSVDNIDPVIQQEVSQAECMEDVYNQLAARVMVEAEASSADHRIMVGIVGVPGSGKSTTAEAVCHLLNERLPGPPCQAVVVSMDGALCTQN